MKKTIPTEARQKETKPTDQKRGDATRQALIAAGLELFGEYGVKGTTTRMLSKHADVNIAAIPYYFGSKEGLYLAVMEHIIDRVNSRMNKRDFDPKAMAEMNLDNMSKEEALQTFKNVMGTMVRTFVQSNEPMVWAKIIVREQTSPTEAFNYLYDRQLKYVQKMLCQLVGAYTGKPSESMEVKIKVHALRGQVLAFIISRESILRDLDTKKLTSEHFDTIQSILMSHIEACLRV